MEIELWPALLIAGGGLVAGFANVVAGGGSLLTMPLLIFAGLPATAANGTVRIAVLVQSLTAIARYQRDGAIPWRRVPALAIPILLGAGGGLAVAQRFGDAEFETLLGWVTLAAGLLVAIGPGKLFGRRRGQVKGLSVGLVLALLASGFYGGLVQAGVGYVVLAALTLGGGYDLVTANVLKMVLILIYTPVAIAVFGAAGKLDLGYGGILAAAQAVGGYAGASATLARGGRVIRPILFLAVLGSGIKLVFF